MKHKYIKILFFILLTVMLWPLSLMLAEAAPNFKERDEIIPLEFVQDDYVDPSLKNFSILYWALGKFSSDNQDAIDKYMIINECQMYKENVIDDINWRYIRDAAKKSIDKKSKNAPYRYEIIIPIYLKTYNVEKGYFELSPKSVKKQTSRFEIINDYAGDICDGWRSVPGYPESVIFELTLPFFLDRIPVEKETAQLYINEMYNLHNRKMANDRLYTGVSSLGYYKRKAYLRLMVDVLQYKKDVRRSWDSVQSVLLAHLDSFEVYADYEKTKLLYKDEGKSRRGISRRERPKDPKDKN